jgi:polyhydroxybutyrate depolymerase
VRAGLAIAAALVAGLSAGPAAGTGCGGADAPCAVDGGRYYAAAPLDWNGARPLPAVVFFHGYGGSGAATLSNDALRRTVHEAGYLFVAPDGAAGSWAHVGSPSAARDELAFIDRVLADLARRWPLERERLLAAGFSQGGSMVWDLACYRSDAFAGFVAVAGAFWEPLPESCPGGPVRLRHVHGWADEVVPIEGRAIRQAFLQGDVIRGFALWRRHNRCAMPPDGRTAAGPLACRVWAGSCRRGGALQLCLHEGGHAFRSGWLADAIRWLERGARR